MNKTLAYVLGNGVTRLQVNCENLLDYGVVYGCNRIYEEFSPTVLVSTDKDMSLEIQESGYSSTHFHYTRSQWKIKNSGSHILPWVYHGCSSGPAALGLAADSVAESIFVIGFDFTSSNSNINNIFAGTNNYKPKDAPPTPWRNWVDQIDLIVHKNPNKKFLHVNPCDNFVPDRLKKHDNFVTITM